MVLVVDVIVGYPAQLLHAFRMVIFEHGAFLEEEGELLRSWIVVSPRRPPEGNEQRMQDEAQHTLAEAMLCLSLLSKVETPI